MSIDDYRRRILKDIFKLNQKPLESLRLKARICVFL